MRPTDYKYLAGFIGVPGIVFVSLLSSGWLTFFAPFVAFVAIPVLEQIIPRKLSALVEENEVGGNADWFFDILLYLNVPIQYSLLIWYFDIVTYSVLLPHELVGKTLAMGLSCGVIGINVAHELGHRTRGYEKMMAKSLLLTSLYMHFYIEHNRGHHKNVSTKMDPASARFNEPIYLFWFRSIVGSYFSAWNLEILRLKRSGKWMLSLHNEMLRFLIFQILAITLVGILWGPQTAGLFMAVAGIGVFLLETVNYIEHYGLQRKEIEPGVYEKVKPTHSWNSEHILGRLLLYELTRHSDHHYKATRKFQTLRYFPESPQLPFGYPASMVLSLIPPLWFNIMNKRILRLQKA